MRIWSRRSFAALAACVAAGLIAGAGAAAANGRDNTGMRAPHAYSHYDDYYYWSGYEVLPPRFYAEVPSEWVYSKPRYHRHSYSEWQGPRRRSTCGEYHYWNGSCCVDARRHRPHIKRHVERRHDDWCCW